MSSDVHDYDLYDNINHFDVEPKKTSCFRKVVDDDKSRVDIVIRKLRTAMDYLESRKFNSDIKKCFKKYNSIPLHEFTKLLILHGALSLRHILPYIRKSSISMYDIHNVIERYTIMFDKMKTSRFTKSLEKCIKYKISKFGETRYPFLWTNGAHDTTQYIILSARSIYQYRYGKMCPSEFSDNDYF
jgi:hypothetical protein